MPGSKRGAAGGLIALDRQIDAPELIERQRRPRPRVERPSVRVPGGLAMSRCVRQIWRAAVSTVRGNPEQEHSAMAMNRNLGRALIVAAALSIPAFARTPSSSPRFGSWPTRATLRILAEGYVFTKSLRKAKYDTDSERGILKAP